MSPEEYTQKLKEKFAGFGFGGGSGGDSSGGFGGRSIFYTVLAAIAALWILAGTYQIDEKELLPPTKCPPPILNIPVFQRKTLVG